MTLITFENPNPIIDETGTIWGLYWLTSFIISTDISTGNPTLITEFWPCREITENGITRKIIKNDLQGHEIRSITITDLFTVAENPDNPDFANGVTTIMNGIMSMLKSLGQQQGIFK